MLSDISFQIEFLVEPMPVTLIGKIGRDQPVPIGGGMVAE